LFATKSQNALHPLFKNHKIIKPMKTILEKAVKRIWKEKMVVLAFFLLAGCMQHDDYPAPDSRYDIQAKLGVATEQNVSADMKRVFAAHLLGVNEVPAADTRGQGQAVFTLNEEGSALHYRLFVANTKNITQAHIHCGESGVNGPVVVFLFGLVAGGVNQNGVLAEGTITSENIIARDSSAACMGGLATFENLLERMRNGSAYVNVHTLAYPGGEIRGQIN
jgi:hypothetical protein